MTREARAPIIAAAEEGKTVSLGPNRVAFLLNAPAGGRTPREPAQQEVACGRAHYIAGWRPVLR